MKPMYDDTAPLTPQKKTGYRQQFVDQVAPTPSFLRGLKCGILFLGACNTLVPGQFGVVDWPLWVRALCATAMVLAGIHFLKQQKGYTVASRIAVE
jgi:hypothetical protein